jgi:ribulose bisphosphate carboxylase small subunit
MAYYIAPRFLDKLAVHITKNFLNLPGVRVPLILGIHGRKGEGKTFQCELVFEKMGIEVTMISGGELESPDAGDPARLIRLRYRETAELIKVRGKMCILMINDLDAGAGRFDEGTQYTVNTQLVNATLMNIADNPTDVQLPGSYDTSPLCRVPIIVTGNDFSTLYAPLIRDGRMEKFYWEPDRDDKVGIVAGIFEEDGLSKREVEQFVDTFAGQSVDFYSALRSRIYDEQIRELVHEVGYERVSQRVVNSLEGAPLFKKPNFNLSKLIEMGHFMVSEQQSVQNSQLVGEYNRSLYSRKAIPRPLVNPPETNLPNPPNTAATSNVDYYKQYAPGTFDASQSYDTPKVANIVRANNTSNTEATQNTFDASKTYGTPMKTPELSTSSKGNGGSTGNTFDASKTYGTPMKTPELGTSSKGNGGSTGNTFDASKTYGTPMKTPELGTSSKGNGGSTGNTFDASKTYGTPMKTPELSASSTVNAENIVNTYDASKTYGTPMVAPVLGTSSTVNAEHTPNTYDASKTYGTPKIAPVLSLSSSTVDRGSTSNTYDASKTYGTPMVTPVLGTSNTYDASKTYGTFTRYNTIDLHNTTSSSLSSHLTLETQEQIRQILSQGYKIALEHVDERRFRMGSWQSCTVGELNADSDAISAVEACLAEYSGEYIRLVGIEPVARKRVIETIIQRPNAIVVG